MTLSRPAFVQPHFSPVSPSSLGTVQRTLLVPLWARARERELLDDPSARRTLDALDWDCSVLDRTAQASQLGCVVRAAQIDRWIRSFAARPDRVTVVELGVGLNSRSARIPLTNIEWIEVDLPDVITLREHCVPRTGRETRVALDLRDVRALRRLAADLGRPTMAVAEGVLVYLREREARAVISTLFGHRWIDTVAFDCMAPIVRRLQSLHDAMRHFDARFDWSVDDPRSLQAWARDARVKDIVSFYDLLFAHSQRLPSWMRFASPLVERLYPAVRDCYSIVRMQRQ